MGRKNIHKYLMKTILLLVGLFSLQYHSQSFRFKPDDDIDGGSFRNSIRQLNKDILQNYKDNDQAKFNDNVFRLYILDGDYEKGLYHLNEIRNEPESASLNYREIIGLAFELYATANMDSEKIPFQEKYEKTFEKKLNSISEISKIYMGSFFTNPPNILKENLLKLIKSSVKNDTIGLADAMKLCRTYLNYIIARDTRPMAISLIKKVEEQQYVIHDSIIVKTKKGNEIALRIIKYKKGEAKEPAVLNFSIYDRGAFNHVEKLGTMKGYTLVFAYSRGVYLSHDKISPFEFEIEDVNEVIDWIVKQPWCDGQVGMIGGSYDGFSQWAAVKKRHPALKTIIPSASVGFGVDFPMFNNSFSPYMLRWLSYTKKVTDYKLFSDEQKWLSLYNSYYKSGAAFNTLDSIYGEANPIFQEWLKHPSFDDFWKSRMPNQQDFAKIDIPILTITGYFDADQRGAMYYFNEHNKYNKNADHYIIIGPYGHAGIVTGVSENYKGYAIDPVAKISTEDISYQWFDYVMKGKKKPEILKNKVNFQPMGSNEWKSAPSMENIGDKKLRLFLNKTKLQSMKSQLDFIAQKVDFLDRKDTMQVLSDERILDNAINKSELKNSLVFESDAFDAPISITGSFTGELRAAINKKDMDIALSVYERLPSGQYLKLAHEFFGRASYAKDNAKRKLLKPNVIETIPVSNTFFTSRKIEKGSKLIVVLGIRKSADGQINYGTGKDVSTETIADAKEPLVVKWYNDSYLEIPILKN